MLLLSAYSLTLTHDDTGSHLWLILYLFIFHFLIYSIYYTTSGKVLPSFFTRPLETSGVRAIYCWVIWIQGIFYNCLRVVAGPKLFLYEWTHVEPQEYMNYTKPLYCGLQIYFYYRIHSLLIIVNSSACVIIFYCLCEGHKNYDSLKHQHHKGDSNKICLCI